MGLVAANTVLTQDDVAIVTSSGKTVYLPTAVEAIRRNFIVKNGSSGDISVIPFGSETVDGTAGTVTMPALTSIWFYSDGSNWQVLSMSPLPTVVAQITQNVIADAVNSSTSNINSGATFNGAQATGTRTLGVAAIQVSLKTNQNCTVYVDQSPDNSNWDITDTFTYYYSLGGASWTVQAVSSYVRVRVKNNGASTATSVRLQTCLCPIVEAVPRALSASGNFKVAVNEFTGYLGSKVEVTPMGDMRVQVPSRLVGTPFAGTTLDTNFWVTTGSTGTGAASQAGGVATLTTGATADSVAILSTVRTGRYVAGNGLYYRSQVRIPTSTGTCVRRWGAFSATDGYFFEYDGTTLSIVTRKNGTPVTDTPVASGSFNGTVGSTYTLTTNLTTFEIYWTNKSVWFVINDDVIHKVTATTSGNAETQSLPIRMEVRNSGGNANVNTLECFVASISRLGPLTTETTYKYITANATTVCKYSPGRLTRILVTVGGGQNAIATIYDNTSAGGSIIALISTNAAGSFEFGCPFFTGLTIVTSGGSAPTVTVIYE